MESTCAGNVSSQRWLMNSRESQRFGPAGSSAGGGVTGRMVCRNIQVTLSGHRILTGDQVTRRASGGRGHLIQRHKERRRPPAGVEGHMMTGESPRAVTVPALRSFPGIPTEFFFSSPHVDYVVWAITMFLKSQRFKMGIHGYVILVMSSR